MLCSLVKNKPAWQARLQPGKRALPLKRKRGRTKRRPLSGIWSGLLHRRPARIADQAIFCLLSNRSKPYPYMIFMALYSNYLPPCMPHRRLEALLPLGFCRVAAKKIGSSENRYGAFLRHAICPQIRD